MAVTAAIVKIVWNNRVPYVRLPIEIRDCLGNGWDRYVVVSAMDGQSLRIESLEKGLDRVKTARDGSVGKG